MKHATGKKMTDNDILGLDETFSYSELKKAFREKSKKFHPDTNQTTCNSHLSMIRLNQAYSNLLKKIDTQQTVSSVPERDDAYIIYKKGIKIIQTIHPSQWKYFSIEGLFNADAVKTAVDTPAVIDSLINKMAEAYYMFSTVMSEHRDSPWTVDSIQKMREIEKLTKIYIKIKKSYESEQVDPGCVHRPKTDTHSGGKRTVIPGKNGHLFRPKTDSFSGAPELL